MVLGSVTHTALDGSIVEISGPVDLSQPATSIAVANIQGVFQEFTSGRTGLGDRIAAELDIAEFDESYVYQDGTLRLGSVLQTDPSSMAQATVRLGVWQGKLFEVFTVSYGGASSDLVAIFGYFTISEQEYGVVLTPSDAAATPFETAAKMAPNLVKHVPDLGLLDVKQLTPESSSELPTWAGTSVAGGELFVENDDDAPFLVLVGDTSITVALPDLLENLDLTTKSMATITAAWKAPLSV